MTKELTSLRVVGSDPKEPHAGRTIAAFARIGYKLSEAVADIVDNSVDAHARKVLIRFFCTNDNVRRIVIVDDGDGMFEETLLSAMQFGANMEHAPTDLGKFGIGMKSASFSQCRCLSVVSMRDGQAAGRRWTVESIANGWRCERLHPADAQELLHSDWGDVRVRKHGTAVIWDDLDRIDVGSSGLDAVLRRVFTQLRVQLGVVYHRLLDRGDLSIKLDALRFGEQAGVAQPVISIDPFAYGTSGNKHYPVTFKMRLAATDVRFKAHIWPPNAKGPSYSLGGSAAARQGFYFYRNDRLIQAGGWNKVREHETEPHLSLARVEVDLPPSLDSLFHLGVQKSSLDAPQGFDAAIKSARADALTWADYLKAAQAAYRRHAEASPESRPIVPGKGVPHGVQTRAKKVLVDGEKQIRKIQFKWSRLTPDTFFEIDRANDTLILNDRYKKALTNGRAGSDAPVIKTLLFLLVERSFAANAYDKAPKSGSINATTCSSPPSTSWSPECLRRFDISHGKPSGSRCSTLAFLQGSPSADNHRYGSRCRAGGSASARKCPRTQMYRLAPSSRSK